jgi:voltage-gated potassium channel
MHEPEKRRIGPIRRWAEQRPFLFLTVGLLLILLCMPFAVSKLSRFIFVELTFVLALGVGVSATGRRRWFIKWVVGLWALSAGLDIVAYFYDATQLDIWLHLINKFSSLVFLICCTAFLLRHIFEADKISTNSVFAATSSYVLITLIWAYVYTIILTLNPGAFSFSNQTTQADLLKMIYFSLVTITTLGYGDISPVTPFARMLSGVEALVGQLYLAVLIAWLVGLTISDRQLRKRED